MLTGLNAHRALSGLVEIATNQPLTFTINVFYARNKYSLKLEDNLSFHCLLRVAVFRPDFLVN